jgi:hypothetical protein
MGSGTDLIPGVDGSKTDLIPGIDGSGTDMIAGVRLPLQSATPPH